MRRFNDCHGEREQKHWKENMKHTTERCIILSLVVFLLCTLFFALTIKSVQAYGGSNIAPVMGKFWNVYQNTHNSYAYIGRYDTSVENTSGVKSMRIDSIINSDGSDRQVTLNGKVYDLRTTNPARELDGTYTHVNSGDRLFFSVWVKTGASGGQDPTGSENQGLIAVPGFDYYGENGYITDVAGDNAVWYITSGYAIASWNTNWTLITYNLTIPATVLGQTPLAVNFWLGADRYDTGLVWYANPIIYITPSSSPSSTIDFLHLITPVAFLITAVISTVAWILSHLIMLSALLIIVVVGTVAWLFVHRKTTLL